MNKFAIVLLATGLSAHAIEPALKVSMLDHNILWVRASSLPDDFAEQIQADRPTNKISGTILDLRFADGGNTVSSMDFFSGQKLPLVILVTGQTHGAALDLAAELRAANRGIVIGSTNLNGKISPDITVAVNSADEKKFQEDPFAQTGKNKPTLDDTNDLLPFVDHMSEAELVSKRAKDGELDEPDIPRAQPTRPVIHDPMLARAADLLKALAILHTHRG